MSSFYAPATTAVPFRAVTTDYTASAADNVISVRLTSVPITISLPAASSLPMSSFLQIKDEFSLAASYNILIQPLSGLVDGQSSVVISVNGGALTIMHDNANYFTV